MDALLLTRLAEHAGADASRVALCAGEKVVRYGELWSAVRHCAHQMSRSGLHAGDRVLICLPNAPATVAVTYGCWLAGLVTVPANPLAAERELLGVAAQSGARAVVLSDDARVPKTLAAADRLLITAGSLDVFRDSAMSEGDSRILASLPCDPDALAAIVYTSGTTGQPKGVMLTHGNLAANTAAIVAYLGLQQDDSVLAVLPLHYAYGASVLHSHLAVGGRVVLEANLLFPQAIMTAMERHRVTGFSGVAATYATLLQRARPAAADLSALRYLTQAGGPMSERLLSQVRAAFPGAEFFRMYGQTEATARLTFLPPAMLDIKAGSVGRPVAGVELAIRDEQGNSCTTSMVGEVWARGPNIMRGYWQDPESTRAVLAAGWLRTGDLGYLDAEGYLYLVGRRGDMIKTGAHRVHPGEVEEVVLEVAGVSEAVAFGIDDELLGEVIKVCVVLDPEQPATIEEIRRHCRQRLSPHKLPKLVVPMPSLPRTASGKILRRQLKTEFSGLEA